MLFRSLMKYKLAHMCEPLICLSYALESALLTPFHSSDQDKMLPYLKQLHQSQIDRGLITFVPTYFTSYQKIDMPRIAGARNSWRTSASWCSRASPIPQAPNQMYGI